MSLMPPTDECKHCGEIRWSGLRRRIVSNGAIQYVYQCLLCGRSSRNPIRHADVRGHVDEWDYMLSRTYDKKRTEEVQANRKAWFDEYAVYLASGEWAEKRRKVFARAKGICEGCGDAPATQVHHLTYAHMGNEFLWELVAICNDCHEREHPHMREEGRI